VIRNWRGLMAVPGGVVTVTYPFVAPTGTVTTTVDPSFDVIAAGVPLNATVVAPSRC
jgi:hypothetical protein